MILTNKYKFNLYIPKMKAFVAWVNQTNVYLVYDEWDENRGDLEDSEVTSLIFFSRDVIGHSSLNFQTIEFYSKKNKLPSIKS